MAAQTFESVWGKARLRFPNVPALLVRDWAQTALTRACEDRGGGWSFLRTEARISTLASRSLTITFTLGSTTITSAAGFLATDVGRQVRVSSYPVYTIASVTNASLAVLDLTYAETGGAQTATILDGYFTCPTDFKRFLIIYDTTYQRIIPFWISQDELAVTDPIRRTSDSGARFLVSQGYSTIPSTAGQVRYEFWPMVTSVKTYPYLYYKKAPQLLDTDALPGVFDGRADLLVLGAQLLAAEWPGTNELRNPYYNLQLAARLTTRWEIDLHKVGMDDDNQYPEDLMMVHWARRYGGIAPTSTLLRQTDATVNDYF